MHRLAIAAVALTMVVGHAAVTRAQNICTTGDCSCVGDCDGDGSVIISELITMVTIALGSADASACPGAHCENDVLDVACIVRAVQPALFGCPVIPTTAGIVFNGENNRLNAYLP